MAIRIGDLQKDKSSVTIKYLGEEAVVSYVPSRYSPVVEQTLHESIKNGVAGVGLAALIVNIVTAWDVIGEDGNPVPLKSEDVMKLPILFLSAVVNQITADMNVDKEELKNSEGGSRTRRRGKSLTGTP